MNKSSRVEAKKLTPAGWYLRKVKINHNFQSFMLEAMSFNQFSSISVIVPGKVNDFDLEVVHFCVK